MIPHASDTFWTDKDLIPPTHSLEEIWQIRHPKIISKMLAQLLPVHTILPSVLLQQNFQYLLQKSSSTQPLSLTLLVLCRAEHPAASLFIFAGTVRGCLTFPDSFNNSEIV